MSEDRGIWGYERLLVEVLQHAKMFDEWHTYIHEWRVLFSLFELFMLFLLI